MSREGAVPARPAFATPEPFGASRLFTIARNQTAGLPVSHASPQDLEVVAQAALPDFLLMQQRWAGSWGFSMWRS